MRAAATGNDVPGCRERVLQFNLGFFSFSLGWICRKIWSFGLEIRGARQARNLSEIKLGQNGIREHTRDENHCQSANNNRQAQPYTTNPPPTPAMWIVKNRGFSGWQV